MPDASTRDTIARVAREEGIDPAYALAVAERESNFNPNASGKGTIKGLFQTTAQTRRAYGISDDAGLEDQVRGFARYTKGLRGEMQNVLKREPNWDETYVGHYWGGPRAARVISGAHSGYAPADLFSARELTDNPELAKDGKTVGDLASGITRDIAGRRKRFNGAQSSTSDEAGTIDAPQTQPVRDAGTPAPTQGRSKPGRAQFDFAQFGEPGKAIDFSTFGQQQQAAMSINSPSNEAAKMDTRPGQEIDVTQFGQAQTPMAFAQPGAP